MTARTADITSLPTIRGDGIKGNAPASGFVAATRNQREVSQYVADMILELRNMARAAKLYKVMVPLEFAYYEAFSVANQVSIPQAEIDRLNALAKAAQAYEVPAEEAS